LLTKIAKIIVTVILLAALAFVSACTWIYLKQDSIIFPGLHLLKSNGNYKLLPGVRALKIQTDDNETLQAFTSVAEDISITPVSEYVALIFHGNGESAELQNFIPFFRNIGVQALTFDYRGFGDSTGWPSEEGLYRDSIAAAEALKRISGVPYARFIVLGNSIGSGPAAFLARKIDPAALVLLAGFADFKELASAKPPYSFFTFMLRYRFPVAQYLSALKTRCVVLAHGHADEVIPFSNLANLKAALPQSTRVSALESVEAGHNDIFYKVEQRLMAETLACLK